MARELPTFRPATQPRLGRRLGGVSLVAAISVGCACTPLTQAQRRYLADPTMQLGGDVLEASAFGRMFRAREAASGGDGRSAGGTTSVAGEAPARTILSSRA